ncbi:hypothetical protein [Fontibacillus phaseoli]|uniref:hypothetical protein n=1 Tax=Fontibacillus phaseoli TaxID=1416533 RepID=UPI000DF187C6|nr:hypothetical protein [Fontibacillus phaseoli]
MSGLYIQDFSFLVSEMVLHRGVSRQNAATKKVKMDTESYKDFFETAIDAYHQMRSYLPN